MGPAFRIRVRGQVQGVGFRPHVWQLAQAMGLSGWVLNDAEGVLLEIAGPGAETFAVRLRDSAPPLSRIDAVEVSAAQTAPTGPFEIRASGPAGARTRVTPDAATCPDCLAEIRGEGRRKGYAFTNCTHCGPRFTILERLPYDRANTTMAPFDMCPACRAEYEDPADRRFHAQPIACPDCGPRLWLEPAQGDDPIAGAAALLKEGKIVAIKGLGGFHLACDATNPEAIATLRARKHRPAKPLALMAPLSLLRAHAQVSPDAETRLTDPAAPIVLLPMAGTPLPDGLAPGQSLLGWMLPYTPLHHLLCDALQRPLVMTSGNLSGEPQVIGNDEARDKLAPFADAFLMHDREIARRLDDSVLRADPPMVLRRARGLVPGTLPLPKGFADAPQVIAYGGQMKGALCLLRDGQALLGHYLGDLDDALSWQAFLQAEADYTALFDHRAEIAACDLHPDFRPSQRARQTGLPLIEVQHHHAHLASCLGEYGWPLDGGRVAAIVLDGLGLGPDGTVWGGELLLGDYTGFERRAWLKPAPLVGGDRAQAEPWRNALVRLDQAGLGDVADRLFPDAPRDMLRMAAAKGLNAPLSSSAGRLFDAVAAVLGICPMGQSYEGEAAMRLEALALASRGLRQFNLSLAIPDRSEISGPIETDDLFRAIVAGKEAGEAVEDLAYAFHHWLFRAFTNRAKGLVASGEAEAVVLTGGCFQNALLLQGCVEALEGTPVNWQEKVPSNDGGLALGQALVAAARHLRG